MSHCPFCRSPEHRIASVSGDGAIYSWIVVRRALAPEFVDEVPYTIATVDFKGGVRMALRVEGVAEITFGSPVRAEIHHHQSWSELRVRPTV
jgi:uncharacterized OB-fold protein